ncbi:MAG: serine protease [Limimaricola sp.]|uniref:S1C family serine protease n=1 Tax=Limimaricola sp. TaxID=2211665 RepID=UPI001D5C1169|nr:serine protease [Limimaricola sp.]MBI1417455.1 serine protease [Limimaricola sp.]
MWRFLALLLTCAVASWTAPPARANDYSLLWQPFNASAFAPDDRRMLQTALAYEGFYTGLLDGAWGSFSQRALQAYVDQNFPNTPVENAHAADVILTFLKPLADEGWQIRYFPAYALSLLVPEKTIRTDPGSDGFANFSTAGGALRISMTSGSLAQALRLHDFTLRFGTGAHEPYVVRNDHLLITSVFAADGRPMYTRSDNHGGWWSTVILSSDTADRNVVGMVSSSIAMGAGRPIQFVTGGLLDQSIRTLAALLDDPTLNGNDTAVANNAGPGQSAPPASPSSGSGFYVDAGGEVLTNAHVVEGCGHIFVDHAPATLVQTSTEFDLALLRTPAPTKQGVARFAPQTARLNSDVTVAGFPLSGILGGLNVTRGAVSSLTGMGGNAIEMQITAPVQPGNSGGPVLAADGSVVGVVVAKLNAQRVADAIGDIPQNVNFAIRGEIAKLFLTVNGVQPAMTVDDSRLSPEALADLATSFTVFIECNP